MIDKANELIELNRPHEISNGLLLRSELHRLFDKGYVTVTTDYRNRGEFKDSESISRIAAGPTRYMARMSPCLNSGTIVQTPTSCGGITTSSF